MEGLFGADSSRQYILDGLSSIQNGYFIFKMDESWTLMYANDAILNMYDCSDEAEFTKLTGNTFKGMIFPADVDVVEDNVSAQISDKDGFDKVSFRIRSYKDQIKYVAIQGRRYNSPDKGELVAVTMVVKSTETRPTGINPKKLSIEKSGHDYILGNIDKAVNDDYIRVYYQPKFITSTGRLCGYEALSRWVDPKFGMLLPGDFIPILEEYRLTHVLDRYVMRQVARDIQSKKIDCNQQMPVSFNLSHSDFLTFDPCAELLDITKEFGLPKDCFQVEISESTLSTDPELFKTAIRKLRDNGFQVFIDDFGNENSSLKTMRDYEFDGILIDIGYMENFDEKSKNILRPIISMSKSLGIHTLAKGIETEDQLEFLKSVGCEIIQGYYYSYGRPSDEDSSELSLNIDAAYKRDKTTSRSVKADAVNSSVEGDETRANDAPKGPSDDENAKTAKRTSEAEISYTTRKDLSENQKIISAISSIYNSIYILDLEEDTYKELRTNYALHRFLGNSGCTSKVLPAIMRTFSTMEYMEYILDFTNPATLADRLMEKDYIEADFIGAMNGWTTAAFFVLDRDASGKATKVLYTTRIIDESKKTEMDYKDVLVDMSKLYFGLIHVIFKTQEFVPLILSDYLKDRLGMHQQPYELAKEMFIKTYVSDDYREKVNHFLDITTMQERLKGNTFISMEYYDKDHKWFRIISTASKTDEAGNVLRASLAVEDINKEKNEQAIIQFKIEHDALTGVLNRNAYDRYTKILENSDMAIAYILLDVDKFKQINDNYGHGMGDSVLKCLAGYLRREFRLSDHIIRMGGDEFCIIMTGIEDKDEQMLIDKIYAINQSLKNPHNNIPRVSISAGIAFSQQGFDNSLYKKADIALYHTKNTTRDGYTIYNPGIRHTKLMKR